MKTRTMFVLVCGAMLAGGAFGGSIFEGRWALDLGGGAGWLGVEENNGELSSSILWYGGSVLPTKETHVEGDKLVVLRKHGYRKDGKQLFKTEKLTFKADGDTLKGESKIYDFDGKKLSEKEFSGKRIPPVPAKPDLSKVKFGEPVELIGKDSLAGWISMNPKAYNGWTVKDGVLANRVAALKKHGANIKTERLFEDFNLKTEVNMSKNGNSGIYLRGIYEVQMMDSYGKPLDSHHMGALYSRIKPSQNAEKPAGEWQTIDITLVDRHLTVILNGKTIIDNQPVLGCTGGAITCDEFKPGPIYLQGDHSDVAYRNMVISPVVK